MRETRYGIRVLGGVETLLLMASDLFAKLWEPTSSSHSLIELVRGLLQRFRQAQDPKAIVIEI